MPKSEKKKISDARYDAAHTKRYHIKLNIRTDADIIERLSTVESMQGYIKALIREDIKRGD